MLCRIFYSFYMAYACRLLNSIYLLTYSEHNSLVGRDFCGQAL